MTNNETYPMHEHKIQKDMIGLKQIYICKEFNGCDIQYADYV